jgi:phage terminase Nu1 subunit (DNA packaging protein)
MSAKKKITKKRVAKKKTAAKPAPAERFEVQRHWLNKREMAAALGISVQAFDRWGVKPVAQRHRFGEAFYSVRDVLDNRLELERKKHERAAANLDASDLLLEKERAELEWTQERAEGQRLKNAALRRELAPVSMVQWAISQAGSQIAAVLGTLKGKVKRAQPSLSNAALHEIEQIAVECQNTAADVRLDWDDFDESDLRDPRID